MHVVNRSPLGYEADLLYYVLGISGELKTCAKFGRNLHVYRQKKNPETWFTRRRKSG